jgi:ferredoxin
MVFPRTPQKQVAHEHDIDIEGACGGECACSTCHVLLEPARGVVSMSSAMV